MRKFLRSVAALTAVVALGLAITPAPVRAQLFSSVQVAVGSAFNPSYTFTADPKSGIYQPATSQVGVAANQVGGLIVAQSTNQDIEVAVRGHLVTNRMGDPVTAAPTGMGSSTIVGNDTAGVVTIGTGGTGPLVLTFAKAYLVQPACWFHDQTTNLTGTTVGKVATTLTTATWTPPVTTVTSDKISYFCIGTG